ncbi:hypothetical protein NDU88_004004 [Pleurodeles waltl]|uniref:Uncharacterized protein n=1 Tax=Pleurodeles waltl TaxID=8319 RepID=A0AAV7M8R4_PLEWA|nr:hypothetical protein NDU88_004004 [Pleurodeles waltl]
MPRPKAGRGRRRILVQWYLDNRLWPRQRSGQQAGARRARACVLSGPGLDYCRPGQQETHRLSLDGSLPQCRVPPEGGGGLRSPRCSSRPQGPPRGTPGGSWHSVQVRYGGGGLQGHGERHLPDKERWCTLGHTGRLGLAGDGIRSLELALATHQSVGIAQRLLMALTDYQETAEQEGLYQSK